ncbi:hypothetical protein [Candidatus Nitrospira neomarina]|uniref:Uncharacterized protein n=1 Tax=Candidatus Nitrospira neomarina TaxID=3020899 RepID=A0AA96GTZ1_9BACT|nr:hypothetical protein [Candidatus Nitrospira neomarina]WNM64039.1 hypothetical protein PQG83_09870 [Candidatus Nitrospira neomarina]
MKDGNFAQLPGVEADGLMNRQSEEGISDQRRKQPHLRMACSFRRSGRTHSRIFHDAIIWRNFSNMNWSVAVASGRIK